MKSIGQYLKQNESLPEARKQRVSRKQLFELIVNSDIRFENPSFLECESFWFQKVKEPEDFGYYQKMVNPWVAIYADGNNESKLVGFRIQ